jgi:mono/diheme cytochrome c family protein
MRAALLAALFSVCVAATAAADSGDPKHGEALFEHYCRGCHGEQGRGGGQSFRPHVENLTRKGYIEYLPDEYLFGVITQGGPSVGKSSYMPAWGTKLQPQDVWDIIAYIRSLPTY